MFWQQTMTGIMDFLVQNQSGWILLVSLVVSLVVSFFVFVVLYLSVKLGMSAGDRIIGIKFIVILRIKELIAIKKLMEIIELFMTDKRILKTKLSTIFQLVLIIAVTIIIATKEAITGLLMQKLAPISFLQHLNAHQKYKMMLRLELMLVAMTLIRPRTSS
jgi:hypothetical protein